MANKELVDRPNPLSMASPEFDQEHYSLVAQSARLMELSLLKQQYEVKIQCFWKAEADEKNLHHRFSGKPKGHSFEPDTGMLAGGYQWQAEIRFGRLKALKLRAQYMLVYSNLEKAQPEYARIYFEKIARFATYPYFRALFSMSVGNSGLSLDPLPSLIDRVD